MAKTEDIQPADAEDKTWAEARSPGRGGERGRAPTDVPDLCPDSDVHGVTLRLLGGVEDVFGRLVSIRILNRGIHSREYAEVVKPSLAARDSVLRKRIARFEIDPVSDQLRLGPR